MESTLALFVPGILANDTNDAFAADNAAKLAKRFH